MPKGDTGPDINFLFEMGNIRLIDRTWKRFMVDNAENLAEHHFRMFWIAMVIAAREQDVDASKIAKMVMVHDISESRTGDVDYLSRQYVKRDEKLAIKDMFAGTALEKEFTSLWQEYQKRETIESKIVKDADNLEVDFELAEQIAKGSSLPGVWRKHRKDVAKSRLYTDTAKDIFDQLDKVSPHDWHNKGRNRINDGDWKKEDEQAA